MKTYTPQHRDAPVAVFERIKDARREGRLVDADQLIRDEIAAQGGRVSSLLADQWALTHMAAHQWPEARDLFLLLAGTYPDQPTLWQHIAQCSEILGEYDAAKEGYRACIQAHNRQPLSDRHDEARAYFGFGAQCFRLGDPNTGEAWWREGLEKRCDSVEAKYQRGQVLLCLGDYAQGWQDYEYRKQLHDYGKAVRLRITHVPNLPAWDGTEGHDRVLVIMGQGAGDVIQFARYLQTVHELSKHPPVVMVGAPLDTLIDYNGDPLSCDCIAHLDSMPLVLNTLKPVPPNPKPSLSWRQPQNAKPRVGVCWKGSPRHLNDKDRSCPDDPRPMLDDDRWELVSLQEGHDFAPRDYLETADLMRTLDAVVTVDTSVAHLAGTLGVPTVLIPPANPEWRWGLGDTTPWYPSLTIVRRTNVYAWDDAWARCKQRTVEQVAR